MLVGRKNIWKVTMELFETTLKYTFIEQIATQQKSSSRIAWKGERLVDTCVNCAGVKLVPWR
jgi:hypothetical protein